MGGAVLTGRKWQNGGKSFGGYKVSILKDASEVIDLTVTSVQVTPSDSILGNKML